MRKFNKFPNPLRSALPCEIPDFIQSVLHSQTHPLLIDMETHSKVQKHGLCTIQKNKSRKNFRDHLSSLVLNSAVRWSCLESLKKFNAQVLPSELLILLVRGVA